MMSQQCASQLLRQWLDELNEKAGWSGGLTDEGVCAFETKDGLVTLIEPAYGDRALSFFTALGDLPAHDREPMLKALLVANLRGNQTGPTRLAVNPIDDSVCLDLAWTDPERGDLERFCRVLAGFQQVAARLRGMIADGSLVNLPEDLARAGEPAEDPVPSFVLRP